MPYEQLQYVVGRALVDPGFQDALLRTPGKALADLQLSEAERAVITGGDTSLSMQQLARRVDRYLNTKQRRQEHAAAVHQPARRSAFDGFDEFAPIAQPEPQPVRSAALRKSA